MSETLERYLEALTVQKTSRGHYAAAATIRAYRADLRGFLAWWEQTHRLPFDASLVLERDLEDYIIYRQEHQGRRPSTINRANAALRAFFTWAVDEGHIQHSPAAKLGDVPLEETAPRGLDSEGVDWLLRAVNSLPDQMQRYRDLALFTLLSDFGLRSQEAADVELRDVDLEGGMVTVRFGKGRKPRRVLVDLQSKAIDRLRDYLNYCYPVGDTNRIAVDAEAFEAGRVKFLVSRRVKLGRPWEPGMETVTMRKRLMVWRTTAVAMIEALTKREPRLERVRELHELAQELASTSPHVLRHGLAYRLYAAGAPPKTVARQLGHSSEMTAMQYGKQKDKDIRRVMGAANRS